MDWEQKEKERTDAEKAYRERVLNLTEEQAIAEGAGVWYDRLRYIREIEAAEWLANERKKLPPPRTEEEPRKERKKKYYSKGEYGYWKD